MIILTTSAEIQTISVIPRFEPTTDVTITLVNEQQNKQTHTFSYAASYANGYLTIEKAFDPVLVNANNYLITIKEGENLCWRGKIFVTNETDYPKFTINEGKFKPHSTNNEFVII